MQDQDGARNDGSNGQPLEDIERCAVQGQNLPTALEMRRHSAL
jgi:hypothetical protein